jgi:hypothetical protein
MRGAKTTSCWEILLEGPTAWMNKQKYTRATRAKRLPNDLGKKTRLAARLSPEHGRTSPSAEQWPASLIFPEDAIVHLRPNIPGRIHHYSRRLPLLPCEGALIYQHRQPVRVSRQSSETVSDGRFIWASKPKMGLGWYCIILQRSICIEAHFGELKYEYYFS